MQQVRFLCGQLQGRDGDKGAHEIVFTLKLAVLCAPVVIDSTTKAELRFHQDPLASPR